MKEKRKSKMKKEGKEGNKWKGGIQKKERK